MRNEAARLTATRRFFLLLASAALMTSCVDLLGKPETLQIYMIRPAIPVEPQGAPVNWALSIAVPEASNSLDTDRICLSRSGSTLDYYAHASWTDRLPLMVQTEILAAFQTSGRIASVSREQDALHADYELSADIRDFAAHYSQPDGIPTVTVTIVAQIVTTRGRKIVATTTATQKVPAAANNVDAVVQAFGTAFSDTSSIIIKWALALPPPADKPA